MKKILLTLFLLPLILLSQRVDNYGITPSHEKNRKTGKINKDSDYIADYKTNPLHTGWIKKQINEGTLEKSYDQNGRLRYEFFTSNNQDLKSYQRFWKSEKVGKKKNPRDNDGGYGANIFKRAIAKRKKKLVKGYLFWTII